MNFIPQLCNVSKYAGVNFQIKIARPIFIERKWLSTNSKSIDRKKKQDAVDEKFQLIYSPPHCHLLSTGRSVCALGSIICPLFLVAYAFDPSAEQLSNYDLALMGGVAIFSIVGFYTCRYFPLRVYKHEKEYIAIMPGVLPNMNRKLCFAKGDLKEKKRTNGWFKNVAEKLISIFFSDSRAKLPTFYKVNNSYISLTTKCFEKPIQLLEMFKNTEKYVRKIKQLESQKR
ncbi:uncharacterized protein LOC116338917 isoform X2 [Contarinia nasturtii]|uniref:uncharacterized protein LOC116338917 isoform X2 n=1 Tax=Contarinia nasturtii TaxID=265458 RepID=UPI0012D4B931|nr:uncharacterized protein LOC116338917 isoform X2 [Contarinia nasturtii]